MLLNLSLVFSEKKNVQLHIETARFSYLIITVNIEYCEIMVQIYNSMIKIPKSC